MLFILDKSLLDIDPSSENQNRAIENILMAYQNSHHLLFIEMPVLKNLQNKLSCSLSLSAKNAMRLLYNQLPSYREFIELIEFRVTIFLDCDCQTLTQVGKNWFVPLRYFIHGLIQSTLLGEDTRDAELFLLLANQYRMLKKFKGFHNYARLRGGGGSGISLSLLKYLQGEYSPCLCVTDSDKLHPNFKKSDTTKLCTEISISLSNIVHYFLLEQREVENLLPVELLKRLIPEAYQFIDNINSIKGYSAEMWKYLDLKSGIKLNWIKKKDSATQKYWESISKHLEEKKSYCLYCINLPDEKKDMCECSNIIGLGEKIIEKTINFIINTNQKIIDNSFKSESNWIQLGRLAFDFSIAPSGERVRV